jgi:hypothetical protein
MIDTFLKVGSTFDWITPTIAFVQDICNGPSVQIACPRDQGWSANQIKQMLTRVGVKVWGLMVVGDKITFTVRAAQARYALSWLERYGLPYQSSLADSAPRPVRAIAPQPVPEARRTPRGVDGLLDGIAGFVDTL